MRILQDQRKSVENPKIPILKIFRKTTSLEDPGSGTGDYGIGDSGNSDSGISKSGIGDSGIGDSGTLESVRSEQGVLFPDLSPGGSLF